MLKNPQGSRPEGQLGGVGLAVEELLDLECASKEGLVDCDTPAALELVDVDPPPHPPQRAHTSPP